MKASRFKFRAWDGEKKEMLTSHDGKFYWDYLLCVRFDGKVISYGENTGDDGCTEEGYCEYYDDLILMQSTGLLDKNGKEIFEGDVVRSETKVTNKQDLDVVVTWGEYSTPVGWYGKFIHKVDGLANMEHCHINSAITHTSYIIGNIYENPELTKEQK